MIALNLYVDNEYQGTPEIYCKSPGLYSFYPFLEVKSSEDLAAEVSTIENKVCSQYLECSLPMYKVII